MPPPEHDDLENSDSSAAKSTSDEVTDDGRDNPNSVTASNSAGTDSPAVQPSSINTSNHVATDSLADQPGSIDTSNDVPTASPADQPGSIDTSNDVPTASPADQPSSTSNDGATDSPADESSSHSNASDQTPNAISPCGLKYAAVQWLFLRGLGIIYLIAFVSLASQVQGLLGHDGISPAQHFLDQIASGLDAPDRYLYFPTFAWFNCSDAALQTGCWIGITAAILCILDVCAGLSLLVCWICYLSFVTIGQDFLSFQWDSLLLETGFLAIFWSPWQLISPLWKRAVLREPENKMFLAVLWLFRWLLFRLMFLSGSVKLLSGDITWRSLAAMRYHYETQPLPTPLAWYAHHLPDSFQSFSVAMVFFCELIVPFFIFGPRQARYAACFLTTVLQALIIATGNYTFFNWLTILLCLVLLDDGVVRRFLPKPIRGWLCSSQHESTAQAPSQGGKVYIRRVVVSTVAIAVGCISLSQLFAEFTGITLTTNNMRRATELLSTYRIVNTYGLFAVMTTKRNEITIEGSNDGITWRPYIFKYKPGPLDRPPPLVEPMQPRLDWQLWFAALGSADNNPWFYSFMERLLEGSPSVLSLIETNPFPGHPPKYVRATIAQYHFTTAGQRARTGDWWRADSPSLYFPPASLKGADTFSR